MEVRDEQASGKERVKLIKKKKKKLRNHYHKIKKIGHIMKGEKVKGSRRDTWVGGISLLEC